MSYLNTEEYKFEHKTIYIIKHTYNTIFITLKACKKYLENCRCKQFLCKEIKQLIYPGVLKKRKLFEAYRYSVPALLHSCQENDI